MLAIEHPLVVVEKTLVTTLEDRVKKVEVNGFHGIWFDSLVSRSDFVPGIHFVEEVRERLISFLLSGSEAGAERIAVDILLTEHVKQDCNTFINVVHRHDHVRDCAHSHVLHHGEDLDASGRLA